MKLYENPIAQHNASTMLASNAVNAIGAALVPMTLIQDYMLGLGLGMDKIGLYSSVGTIALSLVLFLLPGIADSVRRFSSLRFVLFLIAVSGAFPALTLLSVNLFGKSLSPITIFILLVGAYAMYSVMCSGLFASFDPKAMVRLGLSGDGIMRFMGVQGLLCDIISMAATLVFSAITASSLPYYLILPILAIIWKLSGGFLKFRLQPLPNDRKLLSAPKKHISPLHVVRQIFPMREFRLLLMPNIFRGVGDSIWAFMIPVGLTKFADNPLAVGAFAIATPLGNGLGNLILTSLKHQPNLGRTYQLTTAITGLVFVAACFTDNLFVYAGLYAVAMACFLLYGNMPIFFSYKYVPSDVLGSYTSLRLFVLNLFSGIIGYIVGVVLEWDVPFLIMAIVALAMYLISGILFRRGCTVLDNAAETP